MLCCLAGQSRGIESGDSQVARSCHPLSSLQNTNQTRLRRSRSSPRFFSRKSPLGPDLISPDVGMINTFGVVSPYGGMSLAQLRLPSLSLQRPRSTRAASSFLAHSHTVLLSTAWHWMVATRKPFLRHYHRYFRIRCERAYAHTLY